MRSFIQIVENAQTTPAQQLVADSRQMQSPDFELDVYVHGPTHARVESIFNYGERGQRRASAVMRLFLARADELGVTVSLVPHWLSWRDEDGDLVRDNHLDNDQLAAWYERLGFVRTGKFEGDDPVMIRAPRDARIVENAHFDPVAEALSLTMAICAAQGHRKGWDGESKVEDDTQFRQWCEKRVRAAYAEIRKYIRGDTIRIYRAITLPEGETPDTRRHPGKCWTYDVDAIHPAHGTLRDHIWVYTAETTTDQIDWTQTLAQNASPGYEEEKEIRLISFGHVDILDVRATGEVK